MPSTYSNLKIQLMATGENNTTWGDVTNTNLGTALEEAVVGSADVVFANANVTLTLTDTNATQTARNMRLNLSGTATAGYNLIVPAIEKPYIVNNGTDGTITVKNATGTGIAVPSGKTMWVYNNGTNVVDVTTYLSSLSLGSALPATSGGTGQNTYTIGDILYASSSTALSKLADVATGNALISGGVGVAPSYGKIGLTTHITGTLAVGNGGTGATTLTANGVLLGNGTSAISATAAGTTGQVLVGNTGAAPSWSAATSVAVTSINFGTTGLTPATATQGAITVGGTLGVANGGTGTGTAFTAGSVVFAGASGVYAQDNANLFWDDTNNYLGIGSSNPAARIHITASTDAAQLRIQNTGADATQKSGFVGVGHYTNAQAPLSVIGAFSTSTSNNVVVGGGSGSLNAATVITFNTAASTTTLTGTERLRINGAGQFGFNTTSIGGSNGLYRLAGSVTGSVSSPGLVLAPTVASDVTTGSTMFSSLPTTAAAAFTLAGMSHFATNGVTPGAGSTVTSQFGFYPTAAFTGATNNYGFFGGVPAGAGNWNLYMAGTADNYLAGRTGFGTASLGGNSGIYRFAGSVTGNVISRGILLSPSVASDVTTTASIIDTAVSTAAAAFTLTGLSHYAVTTTTIGSGSAVTNQYGFNVSPAFTAATNNYAFYGQMAAATGRYNLYMQGSADNYMAGALGVGRTPTAGYTLDVGGATGAATQARVLNSGTAAGDNAELYLRTSGTGVTATSASIYFGDGDAVSPGFIQYTHTNDRMTFRTNGATAFFLDSAGNGNLTGALTLGSALTVPNGGTGATNLTANGVLLGNGTSAISATAAGTTGQVLVGNTGAAPSWSAATSVAVTSINFGTTGLNPSTATQGAVTVGGTLVAANGGTGLSSYTVGDLVYASGATTLASLADVATGNVLLSGGVGVAPAYGKVGLTTHVSGTLAVGNGGTGATTFTANALLKGNTTSAISSSIVYDTGADVGIGGSPTTGINLDVRDGTGATTTIRSLNTGTSAGDNAEVQIRTSGTGVTATTSSILFGDGDAISPGFIQYTHTNDRMTFRTNGVTAFYLDSAGNGNLTGALTLGSALTVGNGGTGLTTGTSGGIPYFSSTSAMTSSALLAANALMVGGGAGAAPSTITTGTGVVTALGVNVGSAGAFVTNGGALGTPSSGTVTNLTGTASININGTVGATTPAQGTFTNLITNTNDFFIQTDPNARVSSGTLTIAQMLAGIINGTSATAFNLTLPTGTNADAGVLAGAGATNISFDWYIINTGSSTGTITVLANTNHTIVGSATVAVSDSGHFRTRKTAANTFVTYRLS